jgi:hypothetical protein
MKTADAVVAGAGVNGAATAESFHERHRYMHEDYVERFLF